MEDVETVVIGGGQAGLAVSACLARLGHEHVILEQAARPGHVWLDERWDSFTLVTPNWATRLPGGAYAGSDPNGFLARDEIGAYFAGYVARHNLPIRYGVRVTAVEPNASLSGYLVRTPAADYRARNVVMATGLYQRPKVPAYGAALPRAIEQYHTGAYRNPASLPPGAVLVVGTGQSGCQIAEELYLSGRRVYLSVSGAGRAPRRYRGKDCYEWLHLTGFLDRTPDRLPSPRARFAANPHVSGAAGGHNLNLHAFARDGVTLLGRIADARDGRATFAPDLKENLAKADQFEANVCRLVDDYIRDNGLESPTEDLPILQHGFNVDEVLELNLTAAGIGAVIWATGYAFDFTLVKAPVFDEFGYPVQRRGATDHPGLYFVGLPWLHKQKSGLLLGVGDDAEHLAGLIAAR
jgi:putative flavoprotein involved in K+ transport